MMTTTLCYLSSCIAVPASRKLSVTHHHQLLTTSTSTSLTHFHVRASATNKTRIRKSRRLKSDAEICSDIRNFLASVGLPDHHIPSTKELLEHGRSDLANIVRRRGHKQIRELLTSSLSADIDSPNMENSFDERLDAADDHEDLLAGQNVKVDRLVGDITASAEVRLGNDFGSLDTDSTLSLDERTSASVDFSDYSPVDNGLGELKDDGEEVNNVAEGNLYPNEVTIVDSDCSSSREDLYHNFDSQSSIPAEVSDESSLKTKSFGNVESKDNLGGKIVGDITLPSAIPPMENDYRTSFNGCDHDTEDKVFRPLEASVDLSLEQRDWQALEGLDDRDNNIAEAVTSTSEVSVTEELSGYDEIDPDAHYADSSSVNFDSSANLSLEEKVANFIQSGDLDPVEDHVSGTSNWDDSQEGEVYIEPEPVVDMPLSTHPLNDSDVMELSGSSLTSKHAAVPSGTLDQFRQDDHMSHEDLTTNFNKDLDAETPKVQNESEINHLKFMLYQKELELSQLKEQIEKEKLALSVLQTKAEAEISKARELISEKDVELQIAEESLSGLKEVQIEFCGEADDVEVAGSFNGWHHRIKMDPQTSSSGMDLDGSRRSRLWSTMLWLYPGVYEIKFVVDGHWRVDPQLESVTRGSICNNILRVDR